MILLDALIKYFLNYPKILQHEVIAKIIYEIQWKWMKLVNQFFLKTFKLGLHTSDKTIFQYKNYISI